MLTERRLKVVVKPDWKSAGSYSTVGLELGLSVVVGLLFGQWLDEKLGTGGIMTMVWFGFGLAAGGRAVYQALQRANREAERRTEDAQKANQEYLDDDDHR